MPRSLQSALTVILLMLSSLAPAFQLPGRVLRVIDGDSLVLEVRGGLYQIALSGIDAPELDQPWGNAAADRLHATLTGAFVVVNGEPLDRQILGSVTYKGRDVALDMLNDGLAWSTVPQDPRQPAIEPYNAAQARAHAARRGLWSDEDPIPPWEWRARGPRPPP